MAQASPTCFLGIDGGGSRCRARIRDAAGNLLSEATGGPSNIYQDFNGTIDTIVKTAQQAAAEAHVSVAHLHAGLGIAGIVTSVGTEKLLNTPLPFASVTANNDAHIACLGAFGGGDGGIVIAGTGSIAYAIINGQPQMVGGWGFQLGDHGSGAWLGHHACRRAALAIDGLIQPTKLIDEVLKVTGPTRAQLSTWSETARPKDYAQFAPQVFAAAARGDVVGMTIVIEGASAVSQLGRALLTRGAGRLCLLGGLSPAYPPYLDADVQARLTTQMADALDGAIMMARKAQNLPELWA